MKHLFSISIFTALIILSCSSFKPSISQKTEQQLTKEKTAQYYALIHKAELALIQNKFGVAVDFYLQAETKLSLFTRDALNALSSSIEVRNHKAAAKFAKKLLHQGIPFAYFKQFFFKEFIESNEWASLEKEGIKAKINLDLRQRIDSLFERDQEFRDDYDFYIDTIIGIDTLIKKEILNIFTTHGYPNENVIGISMKNDTIIDFGWSNFDILLIHQIKNNKELFIPFLENFLYSGEMSNKSFMSHSKNFYPLDKYKLSCLESIQGLFIQVKNELFTCCCDEEKKINATREKYYLEPLKELRLKAEFHYERDRRFGFGGYSFKYSTDKGEEDLLKIKGELLEKGFVLHKKLNSERAYHRK